MRARIHELFRKRGNRLALLYLIRTIDYGAYNASDFEIAASPAFQAPGLAVRNNPTNLGLAYASQVMVRFARGNLAGAEEHFASALELSEDVTIWRFPYSA